MASVNLLLCYCKISCVLVVWTRVLRKLLEDHVKNVCGYRKFTYKYCGYLCYRHYLSLQGCHQYPVPCPNNCSPQTHPWSLLNNYLAVCPEQEVACDFSEMGCKEKMRRQLLQAHKETNISKHLLSIYLKLIIIKCKLKPSRNLRSR